MVAHKNSKAEAIRQYKAQNPNANREEIATKVGTSLRRVTDVLSRERKKIGEKRKRGRPPLKNKEPSFVGVKLSGGHYTLEKLREIVNALETLNKLMAKTTNE